MTPDSNRPPVPTDPDASEPSLSPEEKFRRQPVVHFLIDHGREINVRYFQELGYDLGVRGDARIEQQYVLEPATPSDGRSTITVQLTIERTTTAGPSQWQVANAQSDDLPASTADDVDPHLHSHE